MKNIFGSSLFYFRKTKSFKIAMVMIFVFSLAMIFVMKLSDNVYQSTPELMDSLYAQLQESGYNEVEIYNKTYYTLHMSVGKIMRIVSDKDVSVLFLEIAIILMAASEWKCNVIKTFLSRKGKVLEWLLGKVLFIESFSVFITLIQMLLAIFLGSAIWSLTVEEEVFGASILRVGIGSCIGYIIIMMLGLLCTYVCRGKIAIGYVLTLFLYYVVPILINIFGIDSSFCIQNITKQIIDIHTSNGSYLVGIYGALIYLVILFCGSYYIVSRSKMRK